MEKQKLSEFYKVHGWTQRANARDIDGKSVSSYSAFAVSWCLYGAMEKLNYFFDDKAEVRSKLLEGVILFNDYNCKSKEQLIEELEKRGL